MRKITLFAMLLVSVLAGYAQSAIVGTYTGDMNLTHLDESEGTMEGQSVTISEVDGKINVTFPSFTIMTGTELGEFVVEDVVVSDNGDGTFDMTKEPFTITPPPAPNGMTTSYGQCTLIGTVYDDGSVEISIEVKQNPAMALTTVYFYAEGEPAVDYSAIVGSYTGGLNISHLMGEPVTMEGQSVTISEVDGKVNVTYPSFTIMTGTELGEFVIEDVAVVAGENGSFTLSKEEFSISVEATNGMVVVYPCCTFVGTMHGESAEMTVEVKQNPAMALTTAKFSTSGIVDEPGDEPEVDSSVFEWGTATWNTEDGVVYEDLKAFEAAGLTLTFPNPTNYALNFFNVVLVNFDLYIDGSEEPVKASSSAQGSTEVAISYPFVEGHSYKIVTTGASLAQANLATYTTDTLTTTEDSYEISFTIEGPELVGTIEVEGYMSLAITNQEYTKTVSLVNVDSICGMLGISNISEAEMHALRPNGSYCDYMSYFDWWRDADGDFTPYNAGYNSVFGHNAYPAVYSIKVNEAADSVTYYFYDYWKVIEENEETNTGGSTIARAPQTVYSNDTVAWDNGDGTFTNYRRSYRVEVGKDYVSEVMYVANKKSVILRATLHFVSEEEWHKTTVEQPSAVVAAEPVAYYSISGVRQDGLQKGINIVRYADGTTRKVMVK